MQGINCSEEQVARTSALCGGLSSVRRSHRHQHGQATRASLVLMSTLTFEAVRVGRTCRT